MMAKPGQCVVLRSTCWASSCLAPTRGTKCPTRPRSGDARSLIAAADHTQDSRRYDTSPRGGAREARALIRGALPPPRTKLGQRSSPFWRGRPCRCSSKPVEVLGQEDFLTPVGWASNREFRKLGPTAPDHRCEASSAPPLFLRSSRARSVYGPGCCDSGCEASVPGAGLWAPPSKLFGPTDTGTWTHWTNHATPWSNSGGWPQRKTPACHVHSRITTTNNVQRTRRRGSGWFGRDGRTRSSAAVDGQRPRKSRG